MRFGSLCTYNFPSFRMRVFGAASIPIQVHSIRFEPEKEIILLKRNLLDCQ